MRLSKKENVEERERLRARSSFGRLALVWYFMQDSGPPSALDSLLFLITHFDWPCPVKMLLDASKYLLPMALFFFKFLEWWYHEPRFEAPPSPIPPAPEPPKVRTSCLPST